MRHNLRDFFEPDQGGVEIHVELATIGTLHDDSTHNKTGKPQQKNNSRNERRLLARIRTEKRVASYSMACPSISRWIFCSTSSTFTLASLFCARSTNRKTQTDVRLYSKTTVLLTARPSIGRFRTSRGAKAIPAILKAVMTASESETGLDASYGVSFSTFRDATGNRNMRGWSDFQAGLCGRTRHVFHPQRMTSPAKQFSHRSCCKPIAGFDQREELSSRCLKDAHKAWDVPRSLVAAGREPFWL